MAQTDLNPEQRESRDTSSSRNRLEQQSVDELFKAFDSSKRGLTGEQAKQRLVSKDQAKMQTTAMPELHRAPVRGRHHPTHY